MQSDSSHTFASILRRARRVGTLTVWHGLKLRQTTTTIPLRLSQNLESTQKSVCHILCPTCPCKREAYLQDPVRITTRSQHFWSRNAPSSRTDSSVAAVEANSSS